MRASHLVFCRVFFFALWHVRAHTQGQECAVKSDIKLKSHFLIIHKYPSLSVHECHVNEHTGRRAGRGRVGGEGRLGERKGQPPLEENGGRAREGEWEKKRERESDEGGGVGGGRREEQRWVSVTSR